MGVTSEHSDFDMFRTLAEIFERYWVGQGFHSPNWCMITYLSFQKSLSTPSQPQKTTELGRHESMTPL